MVLIKTFKAKRDSKGIHFSKIYSKKGRKDYNFVLWQKPNGEKRFRKIHSRLISKREYGRISRRHR